MTNSYTFYSFRFVWRYGLTVALVAASIFGLMRMAPGLMGSAIIQGALVGAATGAMIAPFIDFAKTFYRIEGRRTTATEGWGIALFFGIAALFMNILLVTLAYGASQAAGVATALPSALAQLARSALLPLFMASVPLFFVFQWSALKGQESRASRNA